MEKTQKHRPFLPPGREDNGVSSLCGGERSLSIVCVMLWLWEITTWVSHVSLTSAWWEHRNMRNTVWYLSRAHNLCTTADVIWLWLTLINKQPLWILPLVPSEWQTSSHHQVALFLMFVSAVLSKTITFTFCITFTSLFPVWKLKCAIISLQYWFWKYSISQLIPIHEEIIYFACIGILICSIPTLKCPKTRPMLYIVLSCVFTSSQMFPTMFKPREICHFSQGNGAFHLLACQWCHIPFTSCSCHNFHWNTRW